jgi:hypothetical protein
LRQSKKQKKQQIVNPSALYLPRFSSSKQSNDSLSEMERVVSDAMIEKKEP